MLMGKQSGPRNLSVILRCLLEGCPLSGVPSYLFGQVSIQDDNSSVEDKEKCLHLEWFSVLHVTGGNPDKQ